MKVTWSLYITNEALFVSLYTFLYETIYNMHIIQ